MQPGQNHTMDLEFFFQTEGKQFKWVDDLRAEHVIVLACDSGCQLQALHDAISIKFEMSIFPKTEPLCLYHCYVWFLKCLSEKFVFFSMVTV